MKIEEFREGLIERATPSEKRMLKYFETRKTEGEFQYFIRGASGKRYIADFYLPKKRLVVEIDGAHHFYNDTKYESDRQRTFDLERRGIRVIRLRNSQVKKASNLQISQLINRKVRNYVPSIYFKGNSLTNS